MLHVIVDSGHSGVAFGRFYLTPGKRSPQVPPGIYEGEFNRATAEEVVKVLGVKYNIPAEHITPGPMWPTLSSRVEYVNYLAAKLKKEGHEALLVSIHANAFGKGWNETNFARVFRAKRASRESVEVAASITKAFEACELHLQPVRRPGKMNTPLLSRTSCPAVLVECAMMTSREAAEFMATKAARILYARIIAKGVNQCP